MTNGDNGGRDEQGRFTKGNPGGPGNPYAQQVAAFRRALVNAVTEEDIAGIVAAIVSKAKDGDVAAFKTLAPYLFGRPPESAYAEDMREERGPLVIIRTRSPKSERSDSPS